LNIENFHSITWLIIWIRSIGPLWPLPNKELFTKYSINNLKYTIVNCCGGYRSRTDDPLRARQML